MPPRVDVTANERMYYMNMIVPAICCYSDQISCNNKMRVSVDIEDFCPNCFCAWQPLICDAVYCGENMKYALFLYLFCTNCKKSIIISYEYVPGEPATKVIEAIPHGIKKTEFEKVINNVSPSFVKIYNEAEAAESHSLLTIAGMGYRKAFEFLVKDYAIKSNLNDQEKIKKANLSQCIKDYIDNPKIIEICKRTVWLGNDQTHYDTKFEDLGLDDLKKLMELSVYHITLMLMSDEAISSITKK